MQDIEEDKTLGLSEYFPTSKIKAFDISVEALSVVLGVEPKTNTNRGW